MHWLEADLQAQMFVTLGPENPYMHFVSDTDVYLYVTAEVHGWHPIQYSTYYRVKPHDGAVKDSSVSDYTLLTLVSCSVLREIHFFTAGGPQYADTWSIYTAQSNVAIECAVSFLEMLS